MSIEHMVALGSSFAAGPGIEPVADAAARRSQRNYAQLVAAALGASLVDATVSGATTAAILRAPQRSRGRIFPPQVQSVDPALDVDLVTITAGGNDLDYLASILRAAVANLLERRLITKPLAGRLRGETAPIQADQVEATAGGLVDIVHAVAERAPHARILLVDYLTIFGPGTHSSESVPFTQAELSQFRDTAAKLATAFQLAGRRTHAELVRVSELSERHAIDAVEPWIDGLRLWPPARIGSSFHPNAAGMQAISQAVLRQLGAA